MITVFLCFAGADRAIAETIAARLEKAAEVRVVLDEAPDQTLSTGWEGGAASAGLVLLLSPAAVPARSIRTDWDGLLKHIGANAEPPVFSVLVRECQFPRLLERNRFLRWDETDETLRALQRWAISLHAADSGGFAPAAQPFFAGRKTELDRLRASLTDQPGIAVVTGAPRSGKTSLAQEFARRDQAFFRKVVWVSCRGRSESCIVNDLASQLGVKSPRFAGDSVLRVLEQHRLLAVLDELEDDELAHKLGGGAASVLMTRTRPLSGRDTLELDPISLAEPPFPDSAEQQALWEAMTVCRADEALIELAAAIAEIPAERAADIGRELSRRRLIDPLDEAIGTWRVNRTAPLQDREAELRRRHAQWVSRRLGSNIAEAKAAFDWACGADWDRAVSLGRQLFAFLHAEGRPEECASVLAEMEAAALQQGDPGTLEFARYELSWISGSPWTRPGSTAGAEQLGFDFGI